VITLSLETISNIYGLKELCVMDTDEGFNYILTDITKLLEELNLSVDVYNSIEHFKRLYVI
jgi:hypothetical protein